MNTNKLVMNLMTKMTILSQSDKPNTYGMIINIPIKTIDNINVSVSFVYYPDLSFRLKIETNNMYYTEEDDDCESLLLYCDNQTYFKENRELFNYDNLKIIIDKVFLDLLGLKYDKLQDRFCKDCDYKIFDFINISENINNGIECCVCNEKTTYKTFCNHSICMPCLIQIKRINDEINCPMCRVCIGR